MRIYRGAVLGDSIKIRTKYRVNVAITSNPSMIRRIRFHSGSVRSVHALAARLSRPAHHDRSQTDGDPLLVVGYVRVRSVPDASLVREATGAGSLWRPWCWTLLIPRSPRPPLMIPNNLRTRPRSRAAERTPPTAPRLCKAAPSRNPVGAVRCEPAGHSAAEPVRYFVRRPDQAHADRWL